MADTITDAQWADYGRDGFLHLGALLDAEELAALRGRIDAIMLGTADVDYSRLMMQLDSTTGKYGDAGEQSMGHKGPSLDYRKIQELEHDDLFLLFMQRPIFRDICGRVYGEGEPVSAFRAMFMNKPARKGTFLPFHQDRWEALDIDPLVTTWTALDPATKANGCVQVVRGSHKLGLVNPGHGSGFLTDAQAAEYCPPEKLEYLELNPGECVLLHNWLLHGSDVNKTDAPRRAFSACYMDGRTTARTGEQFTTIFGGDR